MEDLILIGILLFTIYLIFKPKHSKKRKTNKIVHQMTGGGITKHQVNNQIANYNQHHIINDDKIIRIKPFILDIKFHNDYRDIMTAVDNMVPNQKKIFNIINSQAQYQIGDYQEHKEIAEDFMILLNNQISKLSDNRNNNSGWDEPLPDPNIKSGWDKFTQHMGIPCSIYEDKATNGNIYLVDIFNNEKHSTLDEIKYITTLIIGKEHVDDQLMLRLSVVKDKRCKSKSIKQKIVIEDLTIIGYLSDYGDSNAPENERESFYAFNSTSKSDVINNHQIIQELEKNFTKRMDTVQIMMSSVDPDERIFGASLPPRTDLESHKVTRNVIDDMKSSFF